jgi:uncharacterized membrane protein YesL
MWKADRRGRREETAVFFHHNYAQPGPGIDPDAPEKTGFARFFQIIQLECITLCKLNLIFVVSCLPVVTIPPAVFAMVQVVRRMVKDQPVDCWYHYKTAFRKNWKRSYGPFLLTALPLLCSGGGALFYLRYADWNLLSLLPFTLCSTVFLVTLLASAYLYGLLCEGMTLKEAFRLAVLLGVGRPLRAVLARVIGTGLLVAAVLALPISGLYVLLIGFSLTCLVEQFYVRTELKRYESEEPEDFALDELEEPEGEKSA